MHRIGRALGWVADWLSWPVAYYAISRHQRTRAAIVCDGELLVLKGWFGNGQWALPGGGLHENEAVMDGLLREVKEEVGINLSPTDCLSLGFYKFSMRALPFSCHLFVVYLASKPELHLQAFEIAEAAWLPLDQITSKNSSADVVESVTRLAAQG